MNNIIFIISCISYEIVDILQKLNYYVLNALITACIINKFKYVIQHMTF